MIASLTGRLARKAADYLIMDVSGVGYQVQVPLSTLYAIPETGNDVSLLIHTQLREDSLALFGFLTQQEKDMFLLLTSVSGIGPRLSLTVLSSLAVNDLVLAIQNADEAGICAIPGIGKKTAARIVLELKDKIGQFGLAGVSSGAASTSHPQTDMDDAVSALVNLGYKKALAEDAVKRARQGRSGAPLEELVREALNVLMKR